MPFEYIILLLIIAAPAGGHLLAILRALSILRYDQNSQHSGAAKSPGTIHVLLPAYCEQKIVGETLEWFLSIARGQSNIKIYVVTNINEPVLKDTKTTFQLVEDYINTHNLSSISAINYDGPHKGKSYQINYAAQQLIRKSQVDLSCDYFLVYDFDARPVAATFEQFFACMSTKGSDIIQQPIIPCSKYNQTNAFGQVDSLLHVMRTYASEVFVWRVLGRFPWLLRRLAFDVYCVGCGLCIKSSKIHKYGFPEPVDDIGLGFLAAAKGWSFDCIKAVCTTEAYPSFSGSFRSRKIIFAAYYQSFSSGMIKQLGALHLFSGSMRSLLNSLLAGWLWLLALVVMIYQGMVIEASAGAALVFCTKTLVLFTARKIAKIKTSQKYKIATYHVLLAPFQWFWRWAPAFFSGVDLIVNRGKLHITKTERL